MYQEELFTRSIKTQGKLGAGCYGEVHALNDDWVIKYATKDGTLNYLEWCKTMQAAGRGMKGMPEIDVIVHLSETRYMVTMRRYAKTYGEHCDETGECRYGVRATLFIEDSAFSAIEDAYLSYSADVLGELTGYRSPFCDCHSGNIMWDSKAKDWVLTDPCSANYRLPRAKFPFQMYVEEEAIT